VIKYNLEEVDDVAKKLISSVSSKVLLINGSMGVGKTTLIKAIVKALESKDEVSSPTFSLVNEYEKDNESIYHFDLYRVNTIEELFDFGIEDYFNSNSWCLIEWPELIKDYLNSDYNEIYLTTNDDSSRSLEIKFNKQNNAPNYVL
jgi:tRNA threonylcarbamoyladenosine biosynthesis protein TsaE